MHIPPFPAHVRRGYRLPESLVCILKEQGKCQIHSVKPETCRAGPFTFDVKGVLIVIFLKYERICPLVKLLKEIPEAYQQQYDLAVKSITNLVGNLTSDEINAICCIDEPDTEKVSEVPRKKSGIMYDNRH